MVPQHPDYPPTLGATHLGNGRYRFLVWAPNVNKLELKLLDPHERLLEMRPQECGYYELTVDGLESGTRYFYRIDDARDRPDPASRFQPDGVHGPSAAVATQFDWSDRHWRGIPLEQYITYELHIGTFSPVGTFAAAIEYLDDLKELGITAIEIMPVAQFPGERNWGYDGVHPFAVQNTYGEPADLKRLVDAAHGRGLAVVMDVVYNHVGPEGNYLEEFGRYFTDRHHTPWGRAINFDDRDSDQVRRFFIENALYWLREFHIDALRLDAVHMIFDFSAQPFLQQLADAVRLEGRRLNRRVYTIAESSQNDPHLLASKALGGCGIDAQWCDDLHHALRAELTGEQSGYYADYRGFDDIVKAYRSGFVLDGRYSAFRGRRHGDSARQIEPIRLVVCSQNHDQVGNRLLGERLPELVGFEELKLVAAAVILSPFQPLLFMGEEYAETAPFQYFISHTDPELVEAVRRGRKQEFAKFRWQGEPPDAQDVSTFLRCKLQHDLKQTGHHRVLREFYKRLIELRKSEPSLAYPERRRIETMVLQPGCAMAVRSWWAEGQLFAVYNFGAEATTVSAALPCGAWDKSLDSADTVWNGPGSALPHRVDSQGRLQLPLAPYAIVLYKQREENA